MPKTEKKHSKNGGGKAFCYLAGSVALCVMACTVIPKVEPHITGKINKMVNKISNAKKPEDEWGPKIERKHPEEPKED